MTPDSILHSGRGRIPFIALYLSALFIFASAACQSASGPGSSSFASVTIKNRSAAEIATATAKVFEADGYQGGRSGAKDMVFEKPASRATSRAREGIAATQAGAQTINRVRVQIVPVSETEHRLQCQAFMVTGGSDPFFQDEVPVAGIRSRPYRSLLEKVAKQLK